MKNNWTPFIPITDIFSIPHAIDENTNNRVWKDITMDGKKGGIKGADLIKNNPYLKQNDVGIYWMRIKKRSKKHKTKTWNYIGKSAKFSGNQNAAQIGIAGRVCEHINKMQNLPHRGEIINALVKKYLLSKGQNSNKNDIKKFKNKEKEKCDDFIQKLKDKKFPNYQSFRDYLSYKQQQTYHLESEFKDFFRQHKSAFKNFKTTKKFFQSVEVRFLKLPLQNYTNSKERPYRKMVLKYQKENKYFSQKEIHKIENAKDKSLINEIKLYQSTKLHFEHYVAKAEATCMGAFKAGVSDVNGLPEFNDNDETKGFVDGFILSEKL